MTLRRKEKWGGRENEFSFCRPSFPPVGVCGRESSDSLLPCLTPPPTHMNSPCSWLFPLKRPFPIATPWSGISLSGREETRVISGWDQHGKGPRGEKNFKTGGPYDVGYEKSLAENLRKK